MEVSERHDRTELDLWPWRSSDDWVEFTEVPGILGTHPLAIPAAATPLLKETVKATNSSSSIPRQQKIRMTCLLAVEG